MPKPRRGEAVARHVKRRIRDPVTGEAKRPGPVTFAPASDGGPVARRSAPMSSAAEFIAVMRSNSEVIRDVVAEVTTLALEGGPEERVAARGFLALMRCHAKLITTVCDTAEKWLNKTEPS